jgi:cell shape-determining protein MreC
MKMNSRHANIFLSRSPDRSGWKKPAILALLVVALYLWGSGAFADLFSFATYPFLRLSGRISENFSDSLKSRQVLLADNVRLTNENVRLTIEAKDVARLAAENDLLRGYHSEATTGSAKKIYAKIIVKPDHLLYDEIVIDAGRDQIPSLRVGRLVFADSRVVLGQIEQVADHFSKVKLYSQAGVSLPVAVGDNQNPTVALGLGAGNFSVSLPRGVEVKIGDAINTTIVGNYLLGYVGSIEKNPNDPFQKIQLRSPYNVLSLDWVLLSND